MITSADCLKKYGEASERNPCMILWDVPADIEIGHIPKKIFCNKDMVGPLEQAFRNLIARGEAGNLVTYDGCFNIRRIRGRKSMSLHSWGVAIDVNAFENPLGKKGKMSKAFAQCFIDAGFDWGGNFKSRSDYMHFELGKI